MVPKIQGEKRGFFSDLETKKSGYKFNFQNFQILILASTHLFFVFLFIQRRVNIIYLFLEPPNNNFSFSPTFFIFIHTTLVSKCYLIVNFNNSQI